MPRKLLRRVLPTPHRLRSRRSLRVFGSLLSNRQLWALNRRAVARATAAGLFIAFVPAPGHMVLATVAAIWLRFNLPVAVVMVWVTNPVTFPVIFYGAYRLGAWLLDTPARHVHFEMSFQWLAGEVHDIWAPLLLGCFVFGLVSALLGHAAVTVAWRIHVSRSWRLRQRRDPPSRGRDPRPLPTSATPDAVRVAPVSSHDRGAAGVTPDDHPPGSAPDPRVRRPPGRG